MPSSASVTVRYHREFVVESEEPISPESLSVSAAVADMNRPSKPNSVATAVLWAYFQACEQGLLSDETALPWEDFSPGETSDGSPSSQHDRWITFLGNLITDANWTTWLGDSSEAKSRALAAYRPLLPRGDSAPRQDAE